MRDRRVTRSTGARLARRGRTAGLAAALVAGLLLTGCDNPSRLAGIAAQVADTGTHGPADRAYGRQFAALIAQDGHDRLVKANGLGPDRKAADLSTRLRDAERALAALAAPAAQTRTPLLQQAAGGPHAFDTDWRIARSTLYLAPAGPETGTAPFAFSGLQARRSEIAVVPVGNRPYRLRLVCDGPMTVDGTTGIATYRAGQTVSIADDAPDPGGRRILLLPGPDLDRCEAIARIGGADRRFAIVRAERARPALATLDRRFDVCRLPDRRRLTPLQGAFYSGRWLSETCPFRPGRIDILASEEDGFNAKVEALLGQGLPAGFLAAGNPEAPIDFSRAPRLTLIYVSYLDIKADFSGRVIARLLRHHAALGTTIRIITSDVLTRGKDRVQLEELAADHLNVELRRFRWQPPAGARPAEALSRLHKVHHVKMLATLATRPGRSAAIIGGRNIHDGFLFPDPVDLSAFPDLQHYGRKRGLTLNYYSNWRDIDIAFHDDAVVRTLAAHLSTLWNDDARTAMFRPFSVPARGGKAAGGPVARHFISVPYADGRALETYYVELIDAARRSIEIINPYLNLTPAIEAALRRALDRGVDVAIIGRVHMDGDLGGAVLTALNGEFVNTHAERIAIYDYKDPKFLLHGKLLMVDGELTVLSSVNFNNRSFIHDSENGVAVMDTGFYSRMKAVFEDYRRASVRLESAEVSAFWKLLLKIRTLREAM